MSDKLQEQLDISYAVKRMKIWANQHPWADTQGLTDDEWAGLAMAALDIDWMVREQHE